MKQSSRSPTPEDSTTELFLVWGHCRRERRERQRARFHAAVVHGRRSGERARRLERLPRRGPRSWRSPGRPSAVLSRRRGQTRRYIHSIFQKNNNNKYSLNIGLGPHWDWNSYKQIGIETVVNRLGLKQLWTDWPEEQSYLFELLTEQIDKHF